MLQILKTIADKLDHFSKFIKKPIIITVLLFFIIFNVGLIALQAMDSSPLTQIEVNMDHRRQMYTEKLKSDPVTQQMNAISSPRIQGQEPISDSSAEEVSCILVTYGQIQLVKETIRTFAEMNTLKVRKVLVVYDGQKNDNFTDLIEDYKTNTKYQFLVTESNEGELYALDLAISRVDTPYYFLALGLWNYTKPGFLERAFRLLQTNQKVSQVAIRKLDGVFNLNITILESTSAGFSMMPSLHRMANYKMIKGGYVELTSNVSHKKTVGDLQIVISSFYLEKGFNIMTLDESYVEKLPGAFSPYKPYRYETKYLYRTILNTAKEDMNVCQMSLKVDSCKVRQRGLKRQIRKEVAQQIKVNASQLNASLTESGISQAIQMSSPFDLSIKNNKNYENVTNYFLKTFSNTVIRYEQPQNGPAINRLIIQKLMSLKQANKYINKRQLLKPIKEDSELARLGVGLLESGKSVEMAEAEYWHYDNQYKFDEITKERSICVFIEGSNLFTRSSYHQLLGPVTTQNYSNFKVVFVSDDDEDTSAGYFREYLSYFYPRLLDRSMAIINDDKLGTAGNHFMYVKNYCQGSDIVLTLNGNSSLLGRQAFKVINAMYQDEDTWMVLFGSLQQDAESYFMQSVPKSAKGLRSQAFSTDAFLVTFRYQLAAHLAFDQVVEFLYDNRTGFVKPSFYETETNVFHVYALMEMSGPRRVKFSQSPIFYFSHLSNSIHCFSEKELFTQAKAAVKYELEELDTLEDNPKTNFSTAKSPELTDRLAQTYARYKKCMKKDEITQTGQTAIPEMRIGDHLRNAMSKMATPNFYFMDADITLQSGLPFCLVISSQVQAQARDAIIESVQDQHYENARILLLKLGKEQVDIKQMKEAVLSKGGNVFEAAVQENSYREYRRVMRQVCVENSLVMFLDQPLQKGVLKKLNDIHQLQNVWMTYSVTNESVRINSFYLRIYELLELNDYRHTNKHYLQQNDQQVQCVGMLQLCPNYSYRINIRFVLQVNSGNNLRALFNTTEIVNRQPYDRLLTLSQDYYIDVQKYQQLSDKLQKGTERYYKAQPKSYLDQNDMLRAIEYELLPYLPDNHYLNLREIQQLNKAYEIDKYAKEKPVRFCVTVYGRNNTENNRYANNLKTLLMQNYSNFHIVFIDDVSDDTTFEDSIEYVRRSGFPKDRIRFVKNIERRFATYNIINSAFNFCHEDDVQVRLDGDDLMIGRQVFALFNALYHRYPQAWVIYSNFKSSLYTYGIATEVQSDEEVMSCAGGRRRFHYITPLTTWRIKLIRSIPLKCHQLEYGGWLNTLYDDALQFPFGELATISRIKYVPYITYEYNMDYGSNDNSDIEKIKDRTAVFEHFLYQEPLSPLKDLNQRYINPEVSQILKRDEGKMYKTVQF